MLTTFLVLWMSAQIQTPQLQMYRSMCRMPRLEYGERYQVIAGRGECDVFKRGVGEVYWQGPFGSEILFPISSPLDDVKVAEIPDENAWGNEANGSCNMGKPVLANPVELGNGDIVPENNQLIQEFAQAAQRAADETDGKPKSEFLGTPAIPSANNVSCYKDSRTHHMLCLNAQGQSLDVEQLLIEELGKLMNGIPAAEPIHRICHLRQLIDQGGGMETYVLDCIPEGRGQSGD